MLPVLEVLGDLEPRDQDGVGLPHGRLAAALAPARAGRAAAASATRAAATGPGRSYEWHERLLYVGIVPLLAAGFLAGRWRWLCWGAAGIAVALRVRRLRAVVPAGRAAARLRESPNPEQAPGAGGAGAGAGGRRSGWSACTVAGRPAATIGWPPSWPCSARRWTSGCRAGRAVRRQRAGHVAGAPVAGRQHECRGAGGRRRAGAGGAHDAAARDAARDAPSWWRSRRSS